MEVLNILLRIVKKIQDSTLFLRFDRKMSINFYKSALCQGMWWAVQTLTSLGYGDFTPSTFLGKIVGSMCAVSGVLVMALPIPIVVDNFGDYYAEQKKLEQQELKKEAQERAAKMVRRQEETMRDGAVDTLFCQKGIIKTPSVWSLEVSFT